MLKRRRATNTGLHRFSDQLKDAARYFAVESDKDRRTAFPTLVSKKYAFTQKVFSGESILKSIQACMEVFFPRGRYAFQELLHNQILRATLRQTLGADFEILKEKICRRNKWDGPKKNLFVRASRRAGKTTALASMCAALLICVPNIEIVVFSVASRSAKEFVRLIQKYVELHPQGKDMIIANGAEQLILEGDSPGDKRRIRSFPSRGEAQNVRQFFKKRDDLYVVSMRLSVQL